jgi:hypothetical protein
MRSIATFSAPLLAVLAASCSSERNPLPPPVQPVPPPEIVIQPEPQEASRPPRKSPGKPIPPPPEFVVIMVRLAENRRDYDAIQTTHLVNLLLGNRFSVRKTEELPAELPPNLVEAAVQTASAQKRSGAPGVFIFGEIKPGIPADVRMVAVDMGTGKEIDNCGNQGPPGVMDEIIRRTLGNLLGDVQEYWVKKKG